MRPRYFYRSDIKFRCYCCGRGIRTPGLQVMSLTSYHCSTPRYISKERLPSDLILPTHSEVLRRFVQVARFCLGCYGPSCVSNGDRPSPPTVLSCFFQKNQRCRKRVAATLIKNIILIISCHIGVPNFPCSVMDKHHKVTVTLTGSLLLRLTLSLVAGSTPCPRGFSLYSCTLPHPTDKLHYSLAERAQH